MGHFFLLLCVSSNFYLYSELRECYVAECLRFFGFPLNNLNIYSGRKFGGVSAWSSEAWLRFCWSIYQKVVLLKRLFEKTYLKRLIEKTFSTINSIQWSLFTLLLRNAVSQGLCHLQNIFLSQRSSVAIFCWTSKCFPLRTCSLIFCQMLKETQCRFLCYFSGAHPGL